MRCLCAFDIDDTLTCDDAKQMVQRCQDSNCDLAVVTARNTWNDYRYVDSEVEATFRQQGAPYHYLLDRRAAMKAHNTDDLFTAIARTKTMQLKELRDKGGYDRVLFFDDQLLNVQEAQRAGFETMHIRGCGFGDVMDLGASSRRCRPAYWREDGESPVKRGGRRM